MASVQLIEQLKKVKRNFGFLKVNLNVIDPDVDVDNLICGTVWYNEETDEYEDLIAPFSTPQIIFKDNMEQTRNIATLEPNFWILDDSQLIYDEDEDYFTGIPQAYCSSFLSDEDGLYGEKQNFSIYYLGYAIYGNPTGTGLSFTFDSFSGDYPKRIRVELYSEDEDTLEDVLEYSKEFEVDGYKYVVEFKNEDNIGEFYKIKVVFLESNIPYRRVRVNQLIMGYSKVFTNDEIISADSEERTSIINSELPTRKFEFVADNSSGDFNIDNPQGIYNYLLQNQPVNYYWGYQLDDGNIEWILGGELRLTGEINVNKNEVTIYAGSTLSLLNEVYKKGIYKSDGKSLYDLAVDVLRNKNVKKYNLWEGLKDIKTDAGLPDAPHNELLQMIATAGLCTLYVDRSDTINIQPFNYIEDTNKMDYDFAIDTPSLQMQPLLSEVEVVVNDFVVSSETTELYNATNVDIYDHYMSNPLTIEFDHEFASGIEVELSNSNVECILIETTNNGTHTKIMIEKWNNSSTRYTDVVVTGYTMDTTQRFVSYYYDVENGEKITYENPLITSMLLETLGMKVAEMQGWTQEEIEEMDFSDDNSLAQFIGDWYSNRFIYSFNNRGDITKDTNKIVTIETDFNSDLKGFLLENNISYNGAWRGFSKVIKMNDLNNSDGELENGSE